ncbi:MAG: 50S ribosome-binding GTPase [Planctomycetes bacterium]|nr:50S ribosome-binding GTPase [Planctomycetota bacterium]
MKLHIKWLCLGLFVAIPYLALGAAGAWWIYSQGYTLWWLACLGVITLVSWPVIRWLRNQAPADMPVSAGPNENWSPVARAAWAEVETLARQAAQEVQVLEQPDLALKLGRRILEAVARQFHPQARDPVLKISIPHLLRIVELVASDLRTLCSDNIPGAHILTISDLRTLKKIWRYAPTLMQIYRLAALFFNPTGALMRELNGFVTDQLLSASTLETKRWLIQYTARRFGFYAIELYSGHLILRDVAFESYTSGSSRQALTTEQNRTARLEQEPLRILVIGQVKAGKSSLINALFGETRAAVDVVPRTVDVEPYLIERDGLQRALIFDTAGYEDASRTAAALAAARAEILRCDLVILVCSANMAARDADRRLLDELRQLFQRQPDRELPPLVVAVSHIDQVRPFREWNPPYDLAHPTTLKATQIRDLTAAVAGDLEIDIGRVIPVCLKAGQVYNVDEGLIPAILEVLGTARRLQYLRCLREYRDEQYWTRLREQAVNAGRILIQGGREWIGGLFRPAPQAPPTEPSSDAPASTPAGDRPTGR